MSSIFAQYGMDGMAMGILSFGHLVGIVLGLGTTLYLDGGCFLSIARNSWDGYRKFMSGALFEIATRYVMLGLGILLITGCGFLVHYAIFDPEQLANPKLHAKFALVSILTVNGYFLHYIVLRRVARMGNCSQFLKSRMGPLCLFSGAVSSASWIGAFLLGALPILNNTIAFPIFVSAWAVFALIIYFCARVAIARSARYDGKIEAASPEPGGLRTLEAIMTGTAPIEILPVIGEGQATVTMPAAFAVHANGNRHLRPTPLGKSDGPKRRAVSSKPGRPPVPGMRGSRSGVVR